MLRFSPPLKAAALSLVLGSVLLTGCSSDDDDATTPAQASVTATAASPATSPTGAATAATADTRVLEDLFGEVELPVNPQRVVAADSITLGNMLALGIKPIATGVNTNSLPLYLRDQMEGVEDITTADGINLERALALNADLLISLGGSKEEPFRKERCDLAKQALPTFCYEYWYAFEEEIKNNLTQVAMALNLEDKADAVLDEYDARIEELKAKVLEVGFDDKPITVVRIFQDGNYSIRIGTTESIIFRALGIPQPEGQQNPDDFALELSLENLNLLNEAYAVLVYVDDNSVTTEEDIKNNDVWKLLTPVKEGRIAFVNSGVWNSADMQGAMAILDDIENVVLPLAEP